MCDIEPKKELFGVGFCSHCEGFSSCELRDDSEIKVKDSQESYEFENTSKFAVDLLAKLRLSLLSDSALNSVLRLSFTKLNDCTELLKNSKLKNLRRKENIHNIKSSVTYQSGYCSQINFDLIDNGAVNRSLVGGRVSGKNFKNRNDFAPLKFARNHRKSLQRLDLHFCRF